MPSGKFHDQGLEHISDLEQQTITTLRSLDLFKEEKYTECIELCLHNLTDPNLPRHLKIKTLIVASNATGSQDESIRGWQRRGRSRS